MELFGSIARSFLEVLAVGALLGAGLPALFAVGIRVLAWSKGAGDDQTQSVAEVHLRLGRFLAYAIFALVVAIVLLGIAVIVASGFGLKNQFAGLVPVFGR